MAMNWNNKLFTLLIKENVLRAILQKFKSNIKITSKIKTKVLFWPIIVLNSFVKSIWYRPLRSKQRIKRSQTNIGTRKVWMEKVMKENRSKVRVRVEDMKKTLMNKTEIRYYLNFLRSSLRTNQQIHISLQRKEIHLKDFNHSAH